MSEKDMREQDLAWVTSNLMAIRRDDGSMEYTLQQLLRAMQEVERRTIERCAKVAEKQKVDRADNGVLRGHNFACDDCASAIRDLQDAPSDDTPPAKEVARSTAWPNGCPKNSSCARNMDCMYGCKAHRYRLRADLGAEIFAETARREAATSHSDDTPPARKAELWSET